MAKTRTSDQKQPTRQKLLQDFCRDKGWELPSGWDVQKASDFFKKPKNKIGDLLRGQGSFGPQIARDLEDASEGELAPFQLDGAEVGKTVYVDWPFSKELARAVAALDAEGRLFAENTLRGALRMKPLDPGSLGGFADHLDTGT